MTVRNLEFLFRPAAVAVIGASDRPHSVGAAVMRNLLRGDLAGPVMPVNPKHRAVAGVLCYPTVEALPVVPDLAVICTPAATVPALIDALGARGTRAAVVLTAGLSKQTDGSGASLQQAMLDAARPYLLRILGPNCLGLIVPHIGLNASFAHIDALPGKVAMVHQSGALCTALLDWARSNNIGFSHVISMGDSADIDFGDVLDFLGAEPSAHAILLYIESIRGARKFLSAARAAARNKPVLVVKAGRVEEGARAAASHTGALAGADDVYDAVFRRAGMLRVFDTAEMFDAVETLAHASQPEGERLAILTNGGGPGVMAVDALILGGGQLAELSESTLDALDKVLPTTWSRSNPVDIIGDANGERYAQALRLLMDDEQVDDVLILHAPTAVVSSLGAALGVVEVVREKGKQGRPLASWLGGDTMLPARRQLTEAGIANYNTPEGAVRAWLHILTYRRNQELLMQTPASVPEAFSPRTEAAREIIESALAGGRTMLTEPEAKAVLAAYDIPIVETRIAKSPEDVKIAADELGPPVALKILSEAISHKSDVGGVALDLNSSDDAQSAAKAMLERVAALRPEAAIDGFTVQKMARRPGAHELIVGATTDPVFGPILLFGEGGTGVEVIDDKAIALPPLNMNLADELVSRTRIARQLAGYRDRPAVDAGALHLGLVKVSQLLIDVPEIADIDINPLLADENGILALDARIGIERAEKPGAERLAIRPYPKKLEEWVELDGQRVLLRPIRPEDEPAHRNLFNQLDARDIRFRFFGQIRQLPHSQLARFTQIDYDREMAFIATQTADGQSQTLGVVRAISDPDNTRAEFAIVVSSKLKGKGLGQTLLAKMIRYCRERGTGELVGEVLAENARMLKLAKRFGFALHHQSEGSIVGLTLDLRQSD
ncbi:MAG: bifunctional acetate--CoA ligase family protein/GNAT family N-acetyltransferase [Gammaproteobacteria bacterium]|nr:bifunctional acetate--CoA ligase family protein/GNAT family N-acetyltransferase [Gammaproteobacteria bacterium]MDX2458904.1 bifunctional acetate--CoA ligase family protein/GNAT family N-acetyltransferase [Gammaproteobacteria bacterium]